MFEDLLQSLTLLVVGMGGVFAALLLLAGMIWLLKSADELTNRLRIRKYARTAEAAIEEEGLNDEIVAVITAAATAAAQRRVRIRTVRFLSPLTAGTWSSSGRLNIMASHQIARRKS